MKRIILTALFLSVLPVMLFAQGPARSVGPPLEPALRQKLERATGKPLMPLVMHGVRQAQLDFFAREDKLAEEFTAKIAAITSLGAADVPRPPRPGMGSGLSATAYVQALERNGAKVFSAAERKELADLLQAHRDEQKKNFDRYVRDLTSEVPHLTKAKAEQALAHLAPKKDVAGENGAQ